MKRTTPSQAVKTIPTYQAKNEPLVVSERTKAIVRLRKCTVQDISMLTAILSDGLVKLRTKDDKSLFREKFRFVKHGCKVLVNYAWSHRSLEHDRIFMTIIKARFSEWYVRKTLEYQSGVLSPKRSVNTARKRYNIILTNTYILKVRKILRGFNFREISHMRSFGKIKSSRNTEITYLFNDYVNHAIVANL